MSFYFCLTELFVIKIRKIFLMYNATVLISIDGYFSISVTGICEDHYVLSIIRVPGQ